MRIAYSYKKNCVAIYPRLLFLLKNGIDLSHNRSLCSGSVGIAYDYDNNSIMILYIRCAMITIVDKY